MERALSAAASGMDAQETKMSVIANNLANVNTSGFKKSRVEFQDVLYDNLRPAGTPSLDGSQVPAGTQIGQGVRTAGTQRQFLEGDLRQTGNALDLAIEGGSGFFQIMQPNGTITYTRDGAFQTDARGRMVNTDGQPLEPQILIPREVTDISVSQDGLVSVRQPGRQGTVQVGQLTLAHFSNPAGLEPLGHNQFGYTAAAGEPLISAPGSNSIGRVAQGFLEGSNVKAVDEMIDLITTQRAYEFGTRVIRAADEMLGATANIR